MTPVDSTKLEEEFVDTGGVYDVSASIRLDA